MVELVVVVVVVLEVVVEIPEVTGVLDEDDELCWKDDED
jgi:hypothetical protein